MRGLLVTTLFCVGMLSAPSARAGYWGEPTAANLMLYNLEQIADKIKGVTLSIVKNAALKTINEQVLRLVNGTGGTGSLVIEDWKKFIYTEASQKAEDVVLNDFFPKMFRGKGSGSNYTASSEGVNTSQDFSSSINTIKNYPEYLATIGKNTLNELKSDGIEQVGVIAQEIQSAFPYGVRQDDKGYLGVGAMTVAAIALQGAKELYEENKILKARLAEIERRLAALENK